jgi:hypothetical protein
MNAPRCHRCDQHQPATRPTDEDEYDAVSLWRIRWTWSVHDEILCGACLDELDTVAAQTTGHVCNYDAPELAQEYGLAPVQPVDDPIAPIVPDALVDDPTTCPTDPIGLTQ